MNNEPKKLTDFVTGDTVKSLDKDFTLFVPTSGVLSDLIFSVFAKGTQWENIYPSLYEDMQRAKAVLDDRFVRCRMLLIEKIGEEWL